MAFTIIDQGSFKSTGVGVRIPVPSSADYFRVQNLTQLGTTQAVGRGVMFEWYNGLTAPGAAIEWLKSNGTNVMNLTSVASGGFTYVTTTPTIEGPVVGTAITNASPAVVSMVNTYSEGDRVQLFGTTGMQQIGGMNFTISSVTGAGFTLLGLPAAGFLTPATAVTARRISPLYAVEPEYMFVTAISNAPQAVVTVSIQHNYVLGQLVHFSVPASFGMAPISGLTGKIVQATGPAGPSSAYQFIVDIDSTAMGTFAFPPSTASPVTQLFATVAPAGQRTQFDPVTSVQTGYNFTFAPFHTGQFTPFMFLAAGAQSPAGSNNDVIVWQAYKMET